MGTWGAYPDGGVSGPIGCERSAEVRAALTLASKEPLRESCSAGQGQAWRAVDAGAQPLREPAASARDRTSSDRLKIQALSRSFDPGSAMHAALGGRPPGARIPVGSASESRWTSTASLAAKRFVSSRFPHFLPADRLEWGRALHAADLFRPVLHRLQIVGKKAARPFIDQGPLGVELVAGAADEDLGPVQDQPVEGDQNLAQVGLRAPCRAGPGSPR